jgi:soluble lytic murein transglycosylase-like protein
MAPQVPWATDPDGASQVPRSTRDWLVPLIDSYAGRYGLDPALLQAVIKVESNFNPMAVSPKGALGLMQLMPMTAGSLRVVDPFDPDENIRAGASLLRRLLDRFNGDVRLALASYHAGENRIKESVETALLPSTRLYVDRVLNQYARFASTRPSSSRQR